MHGWAHINDSHLMQPASLRLSWKVNKEMGKPGWAPGSRTEPSPGPQETPAHNFHALLPSLASQLKKSNTEKTPQTSLSCYSASCLQHKQLLTQFSHFQSRAELWKFKTHRGQREGCIARIGKALMVQHWPKPAQQDNGEGLAPQRSKIWTQPIRDSQCALQVVQEPLTPLQTHTTLPGAGTPGNAGS